MVSVVNANELEMRLVHLTDAPLTELKDILLMPNGSQNMEEHMRGMGMSLNNLGFIQTEQDVMTELQTTFRRFEKAKIAFDAPIVPNLCRIEN